MSKKRFFHRILALSFIFSLLITPILICQKNISQAQAASDGLAKPATAQTKALLEAVKQNLAYMSRQDQQLFASAKLIQEASPHIYRKTRQGESNQLTDISFSLKLYDFMNQYAENEIPPSVHPALWEQAKLNLKAGLYEVCDGIFQVRGYDLANMTLIQSPKGWILMDVLTTSETAKAALEFVRESFAAKGRNDLAELPVIAVIISHSHVDHFGGILGVIEAEKEKFQKTDHIEIIAPEGFLEHSVSENIYVGVAMNRRAIYMYGSRLPRSETGQVDAGLGKATGVGEVGLMAPTREIKNSGAQMVGGLELIFQLTPDTEAPVEMNVYLPEKKALFIAENAAITLHNLYTLRGAHVRDPLAWAGYLDEAIVGFSDMEFVFGAHHWPHFGNQSCLDFLKVQRDAYLFLHNDTLHLMNKGYTLEHVGRLVENRVPEEIKNQWANHGFYGTFNHNAKAVYQRYLGWYDGNPSNLNKLLPEEAAGHYVRYMGGVRPVLAKARQDFNEGNYVWVAEVLNKVIISNQADETLLKEAKELCADALEQLGYQSESAPWRNSYLTAAQELRYGVQSRGKSTISVNSIAAMSMKMLMQYLAIAIDSQIVKEKNLTAAFEVTFTDTKEQGILWIERGILHFRQATPAQAGYNHHLPPIDAKLSSTKLDFYKYFMENATGNLVIDVPHSGADLDIARQKVAEFKNCLVEFTLGFPIVTSPF